MNPCFRLLPLLLLTLLTGCGSEYGDPAEVTGKVTLDSKPLSGATVTFVATGEGLPGELRSAQGTTDSEGAYKLPEVYPSKYQVSVNQPLSAEDVARASAQPDLGPLAAYAPGVSTLTAEVSETANKFDFDLKSSSK